MSNSNTESAQNESSHVNTDPAHLAYLLGNIHRMEFAKARGQYPAPKVRPQRKPHNMTNEQRLSYEFLKTWVHDFSEGFTGTELKKAFRQAAIILHPDQGGTPEKFMELKVHYESLRGLLFSIGSN